MCPTLLHRSCVTAQVRHSHSHVHFQAPKMRKKPGPKSKQQRSAEAAAAAAVAAAALDDGAATESQPDVGVPGAGHQNDFGRAEQI